SRYRPPQPKSSLYITPEGRDKLVAEYEHLWRGRRPEVVKALAAAAAEGDRSENAEYIYRKKELREIDRRVRYLQRRLPDLKVVEPPKKEENRVFFGAWIELDDSGEPRRYRIVGADEIDVDAAYISVDSPLARALLKHVAGDVVEALLPTGPAQIEILSIAYE
ncbi:MAG: transcription elongation factor GreB, partial [Sinobacteraceae bacterium]|nr:transcription elongation factor GreB [Nevskiaceae bacterium]